MTNCVEIKNLSKNFENIKALKEINFSIEKGKIIALLGADGSGKTTLLRLICGLLCQNEGEIKDYFEDDSIKVTITEDALDRRDDN